MSMKSLQHLCLERLPKSTWNTLSSHLQTLLITDEMRSSFIKLQRTILYRRRRRMEQFVKLLTQQLEVSLVPSKSTRYSALEAPFIIKPGDHLIVMRGGDNGFAHHGLFLRYDKEKKCSELAEFGSETGNNNTIRIISYGEFVLHRRDHDVYIVPYPKDSDATRKRSVEIARYIVELKDKRQYNILTWNCETFVLMCKNGSDQIKTLFQALIDDMNSQESVIRDVRPQQS